MMTDLLSKYLSHSKEKNHNVIECHYLSTLYLYNYIYFRYVHFGLKFVEKLHFIGGTWEHPV
jgi:hypothetical protein